MDFGVEDWWNKYLVDDQFRLQQELEAYQNEARFIKENEHNLKLRVQKINQICADLSGTMYGNLISYDEAKKILGC